MPEVTDPDGSGTIAVEVIDSESHRDQEMVQVQATEDDIRLQDESGEAPWMMVKDVSGVDA